MPSKTYRKRRVIRGRRRVVRKVMRGRRRIYRKRMIGGDQAGDAVAGILGGLGDAFGQAMNFVPFFI